MIINLEVYADVSVNIGDLRFLGNHMQVKKLIWGGTHDHRARDNWDTTVETTNGTSRRSTETRRQSCVNAFTQGIAHEAVSLSPTQIGCLSSLSLILLFLRVSNPAKETWQVLSGFSPKRAISDVTTGRLSAIQPPSQSYHTRPAGMQNPGPAEG